MNLRLPIVLSIVAVAGGAAYVRAQRPAAQPATAFAAGEVAGDTAMPPRRTALDRLRPHVAPSAVVVYVAGAVARGGIYRIPAGGRADDAVRAAGGATATADLIAVNLAARVADGDEVIVPEKGAADDVASSSAGAPASHHKRKHHRKKGRKHRRHVATSEQVTSDPGVADTDKTTDEAAPAAPVDLNSADASVLETLPGIGSELAERIVTFRELNGPFNAPDDLLDVSGMTEKRLDAIEPFLVH